MMKIFTKSKKYSLEEIIDICDKNGLITVDCLKEENMISVEENTDGELGDCIWEFKRVGEDLFRIRSVDEFYLRSFLKTR